MWVAWLDRTPGNFRFVARRSNRQGTVLGAPVQVTPPGGISTAAVNLDASSDRADLVALYQASGGAFRIAHTQLLPGLTLVRHAVQRNRAGGWVVTFRVLDAGEPVRGARVQAAGRTVVTTASGTAHVFLPDGRRKVTATATRAGYVGASIRFTCCP